ncbi:hypothetical protein BVX95_02145 [archaeon D22]|nr:hypothetical protein BVX95_02145 [archaeon D22]
MSTSIVEPIPDIIGRLEKETGRRKPRILPNPSVDEIVESLDYTPYAKVFAVPEDNIRYTCDTNRVIAVKPAYEKLWFPGGSGLTYVERGNFAIGDVENQRIIFQFYAYGYVTRNEPTKIARKNVEKFCKVIEEKFGYTIESFALFAQRRDLWLPS